MQHCGADSDGKGSMRIRVCVQRHKSQQWCGAHQAPYVHAFMLVKGSRCGHPYTDMADRALHICKILKSALGSWHETPDLIEPLHVQAAMLARGRQVRQSRLLFYAKLAEKALQTYERDGWGEFPTHINLDRREVRSESQGEDQFQSCL